jgi:hypothetical protein
MLTTFTAPTVIQIMFEFILALSVKLLVENGRVHWDDLKNDLLFWLPGVDAQDGDGLSRAVDAIIADMDFSDADAASSTLVAKKAS